MTTITAERQLEEALLEKLRDLKYALRPASVAGQLISHSEIGAALIASGSRIRTFRTSAKSQQWTFVTGREADIRPTAAKFRFSTAGR